MDVAKNNQKKIFLFVLVLISWASYHFTVLTTQDLKNKKFEIEQNSIAASVSNALFNTRIGSSYVEIFEKLKFEKTPAKGIDKIRENGIQRKDLKRLADDENGFGLGMVYSLGMKIFGVNINAIFWIFSLLLLISNLIFTLRFNDYRFIFVPLSLFTLTLLLFTPFGTNDYASEQVVVGGYRYFTLLAMVPTMHIILELMDHKNNQLNLLALIYLFIQTLLIFLANFVAKSGAYAFVAIFLLGIISWSILKKDKQIFKSFTKKISFIFSLLIIFSVSIYYLTPIAYRHAGAVTDHTWHRIWLSLGVHPDWPFKEFKEEYANCTGFADGSRGLHPGVIDGNGECLWNQYRKQNGLVSAPTSYDQRTYQTLQRNAFFKAVFHYPLKTLMTFAYYKPQRVFDNIIDGFHYSHRSHKLIDLLAPIISAIVLILSWFCFFYKNKLRNSFILMFIVSLLMVSTFSMYIVAWANLFTMIEFFFVLHVAIFISLMILIEIISNICKQLLWKRYETH